jgi:hypothetical protein
MVTYKQTYYCEVSPCEYCGHAIFKGTRVFVNRDGAEFCSLACLLADREYRMREIVFAEIREKGTHYQREVV